MTATHLPLPTERRVRVWFGQHAVADYVGDHTAAAKYEAAMRRRFASLRVTNEPAASDVTDLPTQ